MDIRNFLYPSIMLIVLLMGLTAIIYSQRKLNQEYRRLLENRYIYLSLPADR